MVKSLKDFGDGNMFFNAQEWNEIKQTISAQNELIRVMGQALGFLRYHEDRTEDQPKISAAFDLFHAWLKKQEEK